MSAMRPKIRTVQILPASTGVSEDGPVIEIGPSRVSAIYDAEQGGLWTTLRFDVALAVRFTRDYLVQAWMVEAYSRVCEVEDSVWLRDLQVAADQTEFGLGEYTPIRDARHLFVYFDEHGCLEVAAHGVEVSQEHRPATAR